MSDEARLSYRCSVLRRNGRLDCVLGEAPSRQQPGRSGPAPRRAITRSPARVPVRARPARARSRPLRAPAARGRGGSRRRLFRARRATARAESANRPSFTRPARSGVPRALPPPGRGDPRTPQPMRRPRSSRVARWPAPAEQQRGRSRAPAPSRPSRRPLSAPRPTRSRPRPPPLPPASVRPRGRVCRRPARPRLQPATSQR